MQRSVEVKKSVQGRSFNLFIRDGAIQTYANNTRVRFVLTQKESGILYYVRNMLGIGIVKHFPQGTSGNKNDFYR